MNMIQKKKRIVSIETRKKLSDIFRKRYVGTGHPMYGKKRSKETIEKIRISKLGKKYSLETRKKMSEARKGEKCYLWKGGISSINDKIRKSFEYKEWRKKVFERDNWTCQICKARGVKLNADHIKSFALFPELRFSVDNGRTLCEKCHKKTQNYGGKKMEDKNIIGNGAIAKMIKNANRTDKLFFCSGVSFSGELREEEFVRERKLLLKQDKSRHLVYFSSLAILQPEEEYTRYLWHKREMECLVKERFKKYTIVRIGNISWPNDNPFTLINFLRNKLKNNEPIEVKEVYRYIVDKEEFLYWVGMIPDWSCEMNVPGKRMLVKDIVKEYIQPKV